MWWDVLAASSWHSIDLGEAVSGELSSPHFYLLSMEAGSSPCGTLFMADLSVVCKQHTGIMNVHVSKMVKHPL